MKRSSLRRNSLVALLASIALMANVVPAHALTARGVLEEGQDHVHFDLTLTVNVTRTAFDVTKRWYEDNWETWQSKWSNWRNRWEGGHTEWIGRWTELMRGWRQWATNNYQSRFEWEHEWREEWGESWNPDWADKWNSWEEWMENWRTRWEGLEFDEIEDIPEFIMPHFRETMRQRVSQLWTTHMNAPTLAQCWMAPVSRLGFKTALGHSINRTLEWIYNTSDVYIRDFNLTIEVTSKTLYTDGTSTTTGFYNLTQSFDLYGVVTTTDSTITIRSQFRHLNVTEKVDGARFGFPRWVFIPGKALFMDLSAFSVPLENWTRTESDTTTTFALVRDINVTTPYGNVIIDPEMVLTVPGLATATGDVISIAAVLPTDLVPVQLIAVTTIVATVIFVGYYLGKRRTTVSVPTPELL
jgi:hypothetical protein